MRGYFACPIRGATHEFEKVKELVEFIESLGHEVLDKHVQGENFEEMRQIFCTQTGIAPEDYNPVNVRIQDLNWVLESEFMICDVTHGSWGGGIELDHATVVRYLLGLPPIPILCLLEFEEEKEPSWLVLGLDQQAGQKYKAVLEPNFIGVAHALIIGPYRNLEEAKKSIRRFLENAIENHKKSDFYQWLDKIPEE